MIKNEEAEPIHKIAKNKKKQANSKDIEMNKSVGFLLIIIAYSIYYGAKLINQIIDYNFTIEIKVYFIFIIVVAFYILVGTYEIFTNIIKEYLINATLLIIALILTDYIFDQDTALAIIIVILPITYSFVYSHFTKYDNSKKQTLWGLVTIMIMLFTFVAGLMMLNAIYGYNKTSLVLNIDGDINKRFANGAGIIECYPENDKNGRIFAGSNVSCSINQKVDIINATLTTYSELRIPSRSDFKDMKFIANENVTRIQFEVNVKTVENQTYNLQTSENHVFYTYDEYLLRKEKLTSYIIGLTVVILFSIPTMMVSFKELSKPR